MGTVTRMPARGRYVAWEAGQLAGVSGLTLGQWARRGYIRASMDAGTPHVYSFRDVAEAMVVHEMLERGVSHREIRHAIDRLDEYGDWPLTDAPIATLPEKGAARIVVTTEEGTYDVGDRGWQQVVEPESLEIIRGQLHRGGWAVHFSPSCSTSRSIPGA
jgi:DNA-binding transcriptional MerR regulator